MIRRSTMVIVLIFVLLLAGLIFWQRESPTEEGDATPTNEQELLFNTDMKIVGLRIEGKEGIVEIARGEDGIWKLVIPEAQETDIGAVEAAVTQLLSLRILNKLDQIPDLEDLGLKVPSYWILIDLDDGSQIVVNVGKTTPTGSGYYVLVNDRPISVVSQFGMDSILNLVKNPPIQPTPTPTAEFNSTQTTPTP